MVFPTAVNMFLRQAVRMQGLPFRPARDLPNAVTTARRSRRRGVAGAFLSDPAHKIGFRFWVGSALPESQATATPRGKAMP